MNLIKSFIKTNTILSIKTNTIMDIVNVSVKSLRPEYNTLEDWLVDPCHVYVGQPIKWVTGALMNTWSNPFLVPQFGENKAVVMYERHIRNTPELVARLGSLRGKTLGCWCVKSCRCQAHVLVRLVEEYGKIPDYGKISVTDLLEQIDSLQLSNFALTKAADSLADKSEKKLTIDAKMRFYHAMKRDKSITDIVHEELTNQTITHVSWQTYKNATDRAYDAMSQADQAFYYTEPINE